jgi:hypothetical protein
MSVMCLLLGATGLAGAARLLDSGDQPRQRRAWRGAPPVARHRPEGSLMVGDPAPDFDLSIQGGKGRVRLSSFKNRKPVALVFGSYT